MICETLSAGKAKLDGEAVRKRMGAHRGASPRVFSDVTGAPHLPHSFPRCPTFSTSAERSRYPRPRAHRSETRDGLLSGPEQEGSLRRFAFLLILVAIVALPAFVSPPRVRAQETGEGG